MADWLVFVRPARKTVEHAHYELLYLKLAYYIIRQRVPKRTLTGFQTLLS